MKKFSLMPHILIVDDDDRIRKLLSRYLIENGYLALTANDAIEAERIMEITEFDALVVDVMMPNKSGLEFTKDIKSKFNDIPVLLLTALGEIDDRIKGFESGADDYLPKPFEPKELVFRLKSILRRYKKDEIKDNIIIGKWSYNILSGKLVDEENICVKLTQGENLLLSGMVKKAGVTLSREQLAKICNVDAGDRTVDVMITRLRKKLEQNPKEPDHIVTVRGQGYILRI